MELPRWGAVKSSRNPYEKLIASFLIAAFFLLAVALPPSTLAEPRERHPEIHEAIHALEKAKLHLEEARHDFGGHRKEALEACDRALQQLRLALDADRK